MKIISKAEAKQLGLTRFFTGVACGNGHVDERRVSNGGCIQCGRDRANRWSAENRDLINTRSNEWYHANKEVHAARCKRWYDNNTEQSLATSRKWQAANPERCAENNSNWKKSNRAKIASQAKTRYHADPVKAKAICKKWRVSNPDKVNALKARRLATKIQATPSWANSFYISQAYHLAKVRKQVCGGEWHVDHIVPLRSPLVCGLHCEANLQVVPGKYNRAKSNIFWPDMP